MYKMKQYNPHHLYPSSAPNLLQLCVFPSTQCVCTTGFLLGHLLGIPFPEAPGRRLTWEGSGQSALGTALNRLVL